MEFTDTGPVVMFHFGMTGAIVLKGHDVPLYFSSNSKDFSQWPPKFCKLLVEFSDGTALAFRDPRRLGRIKICSHAQLQQNISKLGVDPTAGALPSTSDLLSAMSDLTAPIKAVLLDQERIFCGIGNYLADEILFQARIHPSSPTNALREEHVRALLDAMQHVVSTAVEADADYRRFPPHWLFHSRWDKVKSKSQTVKLADGTVCLL
jgi:formamidopyrimidine-DNA glycosylase